MTMRSWIRNLFARPFGHTIRKAPHRARLCVEALEDRLVPATLMVNTLADNTANDNHLSLREAVNAVNAASVAGLDAGAAAQISGAFGTGDTILFDAALPGQTIALSLTGDTTAGPSAL